MSSSLIANRYAKAMLKITETNPSLADKATDFFNHCETLFTLPESKKILKNPTMPPDLKMALLTYAAEQASDQAAERADFIGFASKVIDAGRTPFIPDISKAFKQMLADKRGVAVATTITADPMSESLQAELTKALASVFNKKVTLQNEIDKKVLGGVVVKVGNYTIDMSLKSRLNSVADFAQR
jgi:F-type H+-transporting ATPase subunit delta